MVGRPVRVASCELAVADVRRDHELLGDHDVHGDEVALEGLDAAVAVVLLVAPVVLQVEQGLRLNITIKVCLVVDGYRTTMGYLEDRVLHVSLNPLHPSDALVTSEPEPNVTKGCTRGWCQDKGDLLLLLGMAGSHGCAHVPSTLVAGDEPEQ